MVVQALIGAPLYTLAGYAGMGDAPPALRKAGLARSLEATDLGDIRLPSLRKDSTEGRTKNLRHFSNCTSVIYDKVKTVQADRLIVLGGECSETVGTMAAVAETLGGKAGMLWMDAHGDFNTPESSPSGYIGGMCLATACGRTPGLGINLGSNAPPVAEERLVHVGSRALDRPEAESFGDSSVRLYSSKQVKSVGAEKLAVEAVRYLENRSDWIACHLDLDVVDPTLIPCVNYQEPGGLGLEEVAAIIRSAVRTGKLRVIEVDAYNPSKDRDGSTAARIVDFVTTILS
jgi:arginase